MVSRVLWLEVLEFLEGVMGRGDELPPILARVVEANSSVGILPRIQLAIGGQTIIVYALHDKVLIRQVMRMVGVR
jgi:hypothetical protein